MVLVAQSSSQIHARGDRSRECEDALHQHIRLENNIRFRRGIAMEQAR